MFWLLLAHPLIKYIPFSLFFQSFKPCLCLLKLFVFRQAPATGRFHVFVNDKHGLLWTFGVQIRWQSAEALLLFPPRPLWRVTSVACLSLSAAVLLSSSCQSQCQKWQHCRSFSSNLSGMLTDATLIAHKANTHEGKQLLKHTQRLEAGLMGILHFVLTISSFFQSLMAFSHLHSPVITS